MSPLDILHMPAGLVAEMTYILEDEEKARQDMERKRAIDEAKRELHRMNRVR